MPGGPDYPNDSSARFPQEGLAALTSLRARDNIQGVIHTGEGDIRTWVISDEVMAARRDLYRALAYLDIADVAADARHTALLQRLTEIDGQVDALTVSVASQQATLTKIVDFLGVVIPEWMTLTEVQQGDEMGIVHPSAGELGLVTDIVPLQLEPGFGHEDVVSMEPPAGTLVARGSTVRIRVNFHG